MKEKRQKPMERKKFMKEFERVNMTFKKNKNKVS